MKLAKHHLNVGNASALAEFYCSVLGMQQLGTNEVPAYGYDRQQCLLVLNEGSFGPYQSTPADLYWKIGITVQHLDSAVDYLLDQGYPVSEPRQFRDIGYMCHLSDPEGFGVELLQQGFQGNEGEPPGAGHPIGAQATLAHLTLRVADIAAAQRFFGDELGMRLMSVQPVPEREFCLYFYSWSQEPLPTADLEAVDNRQWLWARPYTLLELQHLQSSDHVRPPLEGAAGFAGFSAEGDGATYVSAGRVAKFIRPNP